MHFLWQTYSLYNTLEITIFLLPVLYVYNVLSQNINKGKQKKMQSRLLIELKKLFTAFEVNHAIVS